MTPKSFSILKIILLLAPFVLALPVAMDIYVPALPSIATLFQVSAGKMQLTLAVFMFTAGLMQLFIGPLSDQRGRKSICFVMTLIFALGTVLCARAHSANQLIIFRCIQAMGACGMMVIGFAIVRDLYAGKKSAQVYSYLNGLISFSPMFAPFIGSYLDVYFGWPSTFLALLIIAGASLIVIALYLPETLHKNNRVLFNISIIKKYKEISKNPIFMLYNATGAIGLSYLYLFCSISPYVIIRLLHIPEIYYGLYFCFMGISFFIGSFLSGYIVHRLGIFNTVILGIFITLMGGITMTLWYFITGLTIHNFIWPMLLIGIGGTFCMGAGNGGAMEPFAENAGAASALGGAIRFVFSSLLGSLLITTKVTSTLPLAIPAVIFSIIELIVFLKYKNLLKFSE